MCGILGIACYNNAGLDYRLAADLRNLVRRLLVEAQNRGRNASGLCVLSGDKASMFKLNIPASDLIKKHEYNKVISRISYSRRLRAVIGHTRYKTKGDQIYNVNNHPIKANKVIGVHNGVVGNDDLLFKKHVGKVERAGRVDSEIIFRLIDHYMSEGKDIVDAVIAADSELAGSYACAFIHKDWPNYLTLITNSSPIPIFVFDDAKIMVFASTSAIIKAAMLVDSVLGKPNNADNKIIVSQGGVRINLDTGRIYEFDLSPFYHGLNTQMGLAMY
jgi:amidophosphoribosyltransferase